MVPHVNGTMNDTRVIQEALIFEHPDPELRVTQNQNPQRLRTDGLPDLEVTDSYIDIYGPDRLPGMAAMIEAFEDGASGVTVSRVERVREIGGSPHGHIYRTRWYLKMFLQD